MRKASDCHLTALLSARSPTLELRKKGPALLAGPKETAMARGVSERGSLPRPHSQFGSLELVQPKPSQEPNPLKNKI
jgi:hypothetical protein